MSTSATIKSPESPKATRAWIEDGYLFIHLDDDRRIGTPLRYYRRLREADAHLLAKVRIAVGGRALRWEEIDEDILVADLVQGRFPKRGAA